MARHLHLQMTPLTVSVVEGGERWYRCWIVLEQRFLLQPIFVSFSCSFWIDCSFVMMGWRRIRCPREVHLELVFWPTLLSERSLLLPLSTQPNIPFFFYSARQLLV